MNIKIKNQAKSKKICVEMDADKLERMAANFGFFNDNFLDSVAKAEKDHKAGKSRKIKSLSSIK